MALKTNSRKARENVRQYILDNVDFSSYMMPYIDKANFPKIARNILLIFRAEKCYEIEKNYNEFPTFLSWTQGPPSVLDCWAQSWKRRKRRKQSTMRKKRGFCWLN